MSDTDDAAESDYRIPHELVALRQKSGEDLYQVGLWKAAQEAGIEQGVKVEVNLDLAGEVPMFIIGPAPEDEGLAAGEIRTLHKSVLLPNKDLAEIGIDLDAYDGTENPFLFYPEVLEEMIALEPLGYASAVLEDQDADPETETESPDEAEGESEEDGRVDGTETGDASSVSAEDIAATSNATGVPEAELEQAVEDVGATVDRDALTGMRADEFDPVQKDGTEVVFVESEAWTALVADELGRDRGDELVEAVRLAFNRAARDVIGADRDYRRFDKTADAVVLALDE